MSHRVSPANAWGGSSTPKRTRPLAGSAARSGSGSMPDLYPHAAPISGGWVAAAGLAGCAVAVWWLASTIQAMQARLEELTMTVDEQRAAVERLGSRPFGGASRDPQGLAAESLSEPPLRKATSQPIGQSRAFDSGHRARRSVSAKRLGSISSASLGGSSATLSSDVTRPSMSTVEEEEERPEPVPLVVITDPGQRQC